MNEANRNKETPWNPKAPVDIAPSDYEEVVLHWLQDLAKDHGQLSFEHQGILRGAGGDYSIDIVARMQLFGGANLTILVECKKHRRPIGRDYLLALEAKLRDIGAHKGLLVSNSGFQAGAIAVAEDRGIATITLVRGAWTYETKSTDEAPEPPPWADIPGFAGLLLSTSERGISSEVLPDRLRSLEAWLAN